MNASPASYRKLLAAYVGPQWPRMLLLAVLLPADIALQLVGPQITGYFIDSVQAGGELATLTRVALLFIAAALAQQALAVAAVYVSENVGWTATNALRADLAEHCLRLDLSFHNAHSPGEMIERIDGDVSALSEFFSRFVVQVAGNGLLLIGILILLFAEDWRVGAPIGAFALAVLYVLIRFRDIAVPHWKAERQASADLFGFLEERLAGTEDIRANGARAYVLRSFHQLMRNLMNKSLRAGLMVNILLNTMWILFALGNAAAFAVGAYLFLGKAVTLGSVYIIFQYTIMLQRPIETISRQVETLQRAGAGIARIQELFRVQSRIVDAPDAAESLPSDGAALEVAFEDVSFGYADAQDDAEPEAAERDLVLHGLTFRLQPGTVLGLLGRTGSGKTSLTRLLFRLYDPGRGAIQIGPAGRLQDVRHVPLARLRRQVAMVTQNIQLFNASVRDNLTFFDPGIPDERILAVLRDLGLRDWIQSLPHGLDAELESGGGLSAGEAQLLAFARIFLKQPGLVILDEASSRLDPATERLIERAVDRLVQGRTAIIVAHRLATVQRADEIMILENGRISEHGSRAELAADPSSQFHRLLQTGLEEVLA